MSFYAITRDLNTLSIEASADAGDRQAQGVGQTDKNLVVTNNFIMSPAPPAPYQPQYQIQFITGVVQEINIRKNTSFLRFPDNALFSELLSGQPVGTYILQTTSNFPHKAWITAWVKEQDNDEVVGLVLHDFVLGHTTVETINSWIEEQLTFRVERMNYPEYKYLQGSLQLCVNVLDLTCLIDLTADTRAKLFSSETSELIKTINHIVLAKSPQNNEDLKNILDCYVQLLLWLCKWDRTDIKIHIEKELASIRVDTVSEYQAIFGVLKEQLEGKKLEWAHDRVLQLLVHNTVAEPKSYMSLRSDPRLQKFYGMNKARSDMTIRFPKSQSELPVHKIILAKISDYFDQEVDDNLQVFSFPDRYDDAAVEQFLRIAYGHIPEFSRFFFSHLLSLAAFVRSPDFWNSVSHHFNESESTITIYELQNIINERHWVNLPDKSLFFRLVGTHWVTIIDRLALEEREKFRMVFLEDWMAYLSRRNNKVFIKI